VVALSILAIVVAAAAVGFGALLGGKSKSSATTQSPASAQSPGSKKEQPPVSKWAAENQSKSDRLRKSIKAAAAAGMAGPNTSARRSACQELGDASKAAADTLPTPNAALTDALRAAIDDFDRAAQECMTGVERGDSAALGRFTSDLEAGQKQIGVAAYIVQGFNKGG
jgi:negative regulator of sigma E activity